MAKIKLTKEEADKMMKVKGNVTGTIYQADYRLILERGGEEKVREVEKKLEELGYPIKLKETSSFKWYSEAHACLVYLSMLEVFDWDESKTFEIGYNVPSFSTLTKLLMKYLSVERLIKEASNTWKKHFDFGEMKCTKFDEEKKTGVLRVDGFKKFHPTLDLYIRGYITRLVEMAVKSKDVKVEQTKSLYEGDPYAEYRITW
jgi:hypothetical protein